MFPPHELQAWQLMEQPVTLQEFEDLPLLRSTFFHYNLGLEGNAASVLDCNDAGEVKVLKSSFDKTYVVIEMILVSVQVSLLAPPEVSFHYELSFFKSGNTSVNVQPGGKVRHNLKVNKYYKICMQFIYSS